LPKNPRGEIVVYHVCKSEGIQMADKKNGEGRFELKINRNTTPEEAARLALRQEQNARGFYEECARIMQNPGAKRMFEFLAGEEKKHEALIQKEIDENFLSEM
jgi:rubrerythrin